MKKTGEVKSLHLAVRVNANARCFLMKAAGGDTAGAASDVHVYSVSLDARNRNAMWRGHPLLPSLPPYPSLPPSLRPFLPLSLPLSLPPSLLHLPPPTPPPPPCRVAVGWFGGSCHSCQSCAEGDHILCDNGTITGATIDGGYQQYTFAKSDSLAAVPDSLTFQEAAPLVCAGWCIRLRGRTKRPVP